MNVLKMSPPNLILFACDITDAIEAILPDHLFADNEEIYAELESALNISLSHIRNVMPFATNISLCKYITRRKYTIILQRLSFNEFDKMKMHAKYHGIEKFKHKCLQEFPLLKESYSLENMQPPIDQAQIQHCLHKNVEKKGIAFITKSLYEDIKENRNPFKIDDDCQRLVIQNSDTILIDLEKTYFIFKNFIFKITAKTTVYKYDIFPGIRLGDNIFHLCNYAQTANANLIIHSLNQFLCHKPCVTDEFCLDLVWSDQHSWSTHALISSLSIRDHSLTNVKFSNDPFLIFDAQNVIFDLSFFDRISTE